MIDPTTDYALEVVSGHIPANRFVRLACERHLRDLARTDVWFDAKAAERFFNYCKCLKHYKGPMKGQRIVLEPWQRFIFGCIYGWKKVVEGVKSNLWRFNYAYLEVPRKNGKTTIAAAGASYDCALLEDTGAEVYCLATKEDQAKLLYNDVAAYINQSEDLKEVFEILQGRSTIYCLKSDRTSFIKPLGSDSDRLDGLNPFSAYTDELHAWPHRDLWDVIEDGFGARENWHMIAITTAGHDKKGICYQERQHLIEILEQRIDADNKFGVIFTVDDKEKENWLDEKNWYIANPNLGTGKQLSYMRDLALKAQQMPTKKNAFLNKQLNIWTDVLESWIQYDAWKACESPFACLNLKGKTCTAGMDLARVNDLSAVGYFFEPQAGVEFPTVLVDYYLPQANMRERQEQDRVPYDVWVSQGHIRTTPGNTTDFSFIQHDILERAAMFNIKELAFDRHFAGEIVNSLQNEGINLVEFGMGFVSMGSPTAEFERLVIAKQLRHNNNPVLNWNVANLVVRRDPAGNIKPDKDASINRIDGAVALIMALGRTMAKGELKKPSPYEKRGLRSINTSEK